MCRTKQVPVPPYGGLLLPAARGVGAPPTVTTTTHPPHNPQTTFLPFTTHPTDPSTTHRTHQPPKQSCLHMVWKLCTAATSTTNNAPTNSLPYHPTIRYPMSPPYSLTSPVTAHAIAVYDSPLFPCSETCIVPPLTAPYYPLVPTVLSHPDSVDAGWKLPSMMLEPVGTETQGLATQFGKYHKIHRACIRLMDFYPTFFSRKSSTHRNAAGGGGQCCYLGVLRLRFVPKGPT